MLLQGVGCDRLPRGQDNERRHGLSPIVVVLTDHRGLADGGMAIKDLLDFARKNVLSAGNDDVFLAVQEIEVALVVEAAEITNRTPAVDHRLRRRFGLVPIAVEEPAVSDPHLAWLIRRGRGAFGVANLEPDARARLPDAAYFSQLIRRPQEGAPAAFRGAVGFEQHVVTEEIDDPLLRRLRQRRRVRMDCLERAHIEPAQLLVSQVEDCVKMRRHHEHAGDLALVNGPQHGLGIELREDMGGAAKECAGQGVDETGAIVKGRCRKRPRLRCVAA